MKTKFEIYKSAFGLFLNENVPDSMLHQYLDNIQYPDYHIEIQNYIIDNMKKEILDWNTGIGIIDAVDSMYDEAVSNGNVKIINYGK